MTPDELRALADALHWVQYTADWQTCDRAADYLRAQAEAQPVAEVRPAGAILSEPLPLGTKLYTQPAPAAPQAEPIDPHMIAAEDRFPDVPAEQWVTCSQCDGDFDRECPICDGLGKVLATDGEQAEPKPTPASGDDLGVYKGMADSYRNDAEQAELKREPLTALRILEIEDDASRQWRDNGRIIEYAVVFARMIERAHGIGGSDD